MTLAELLDFPALNEYSFDEEDDAGDPPPASAAEGGAAFWRSQAAIDGFD